MKSTECLFVIYLFIVSVNKYVESRGLTTNPTALECEFPPKREEDMTLVRKKRLTAEDGLVCLEDYPYTVTIRLHGKHWCGGAIVAKQWIISAAQNFDYVSKEELTVRVGSVFRDFGGRLLSVIDIVRHPRYKLNQYYPDHNLALVKLNIPVTIGPRVQIVSLPKANKDLPANFGEIVVTGFGAVKNGIITEGEDQELRRMIVKPIPKGDCRLIYGNDYQLQHDHFCFKSVVKRVALCAGDTGDPAVHFSVGNHGGVLYGVAVFSGTEECAFKEKPGVFTKVAYSRDWIDTVLNDNISQSVQYSNSLTIDEI